MAQSNSTSSTDLSSEAIQALSSALQNAQPSSKTYLPVNLPLAFPTPLHLLNVITNMHIVTAIFNRPSHASFFAETRTDPKDAAVMGVMGLYLSSGEGWGSDNLLSTTALKEGKVDEDLIAEVFRIETTQEKEHETMKGIRVGGRWDPGAELVEDLAGFYKKAPGMLGKLSCMGEWVRILVDQGWAEGDDELAFVRNWCAAVSSRVISLSVD